VRLAPVTLAVSACANSTRSRYRALQHRERIQPPSQFTAAVGAAQRAPGYAASRASAFANAVGELNLHSNSPLPWARHNAPPGTLPLALPRSATPHSPNGACRRGIAIAHIRP
jgi:hypothetical protein